MKKFIKQLLREEINASEAYRDENALKTVIDGKRDLGFITLKTATIPEKMFWDEIKKNDIKTVNLPLNPYNAFIYFRKGAELKAIELANIANKYGGYLSHEATKDETIRIGQLLGYKDSDISNFINKKYPVTEEMIDGQNMNQGTQTACNKMSVATYAEGIKLITAAIGTQEQNPKMWQRISKPLNNWKQANTGIGDEVRTMGMSGDSMVDESNTYWTMIQSTICEQGPDFE